MSETRIYLEIPYSLKDEAKQDKIKWDMEKKKWYSKADNKKLYKLSKVFLRVPFKDKEKVKEEGGAWDAINKKWYSLAFNTKLIDKYDYYESDDNEEF